MDSKLNEEIINGLERALFAVYYTYEEYRNFDDMVECFAGDKFFSLHYIAKKYLELKEMEEKMEVLRFKVICKCPDCWNGIKDSCRYCNGTGEVETDMDLDAVMFDIAGRLRYYHYIHDHGE